MTLEDRSIETDLDIVDWLAELEGRGIDVVAFLEGQLLDESDEAVRRYGPAEGRMCLATVLGAVRRVYAEGIDPLVTMREVAPDDFYE